jgi:hypothetical protein
MSSNIRVNSITPAVGSNVAIGTAGGTITFNCDTISGIATFANDIDITQTLDVDGHTELDNVNISGVVTATSFVGPVTGNASSATVATNAQGLTGSPSITVTDITASGNVSIAGTLTYEDVTNIDSVGVITARSGIHVTGTGANGRIGIGTDNPSETLHLFSNNQSYLKVQTTGTYSPATLELKSPSNGRIDFTPGNTNEASGRIIYTHNDDTMSFSTKPSGGNRTERLRITGIGSVGISSTAPKTDVDISQKTGAVALPQGTTAQRPTGSAPYIRKNTTNNALEYFDGTSWVEIITDYFPTGSVILG